MPLPTAHTQRRGVNEDSAMLKEFYRFWREGQFGKVVAGDFSLVWRATSLKRMDVFLFLWYHLRQQDSLDLFRRILQARGLGNGGKTPLDSTFPSGMAYQCPVCGGPRSGQDWSPRWRIYLTVGTHLCILSHCFKTKNTVGEKLEKQNFQKIKNKKNKQNDAHRMML